MRWLQHLEPVAALDLSSHYAAVRARTTSACAPLTVEDHQIQSMADASPAKWHLAHTTWFFETFVLKPAGHPVHRAGWEFLHNSYYDAVGARIDRARRGTASRPGLAEVLEYRAVVDARMQSALSRDQLDPSARAVVELGLHHEQQHQELIYTDVKHALGTQPLRPAYREDLARITTAPAPSAPLTWTDFDEVVTEIGARAASGHRGFAFDNERPRHRTLVPSFRLANRPLTNGDVLAFIAAGGYADSRLWLSDGFATVKREGWTAPLYWESRDGAWLHYDLTGMRAIDPAATACHLSYYEADAIAHWSGARLPTEAEWEHAAQVTERAVADVVRSGHWADDDVLAPRAALPDRTGLQQLFGDVWEWTASAYTAYPGFRPLAGALGEYNGKFMSGQMVLRGGSCFTPRGHVRASYRNFFAPSARWQMAGVRLATDRG